MRKQDPSIADMAALEEHFERKVLDLAAAAGRSYIVWQEILDNGVQVQQAFLADLVQGLGGFTTVLKRSATRAYLIPFYCSYLISYKYTNPNCSDINDPAEDRHKKSIRTWKLHLLQSSSRESTSVSVAMIH